MISNVMPNDIYRNINNNLKFIFTHPLFWMVFFGVVIVLIGIEPAHAADATDGGGAGLVWEQPLARVRRSFSGPVAFGISMLGLIACGGALIWGGEISEFIRRIIYVILVISLLVFANTLMTGVLFSGAVIPSDVVLSITEYLTP